jgi:hypothetical protein
MSTPANVLGSLTRLLDDLRGLLEATTTQELPNLAAQLGAQAQLTSAVTGLATQFGRVRQGLQPWYRGVVEADALLALVSFAPALAQGLAQAVEVGAQQLESSCARTLGDATRVAQRVVQPIQAVSGVLDVGIQAGEAALTLVAPDRWLTLMASVDQLAQALALFQQRCTQASATPAPTPPSPSAPPPAVQ